MNIVDPTRIPLPPSPPYSILSENEHQVTNQFNRNVMSTINHGTEEGREIKLLETDNYQSWSSVM